MPAPALLTLDSISAARPDGTLLFTGLTLAIGHERIGLVGRNGAGKTTLIEIIAGAIQPRSGHAHVSGRVGRLRQIQPEEGTLADALGVAQALERLDRLETGAGDPADAAAADWSLPERLAKALAAAGLGALPLDRDCATLSGGERTRLGIAAMLLGGPALLLLDEPTNNLDAEGRAAVADLLAHWPGGALVASHDRELLEGMDRIVQLSQTGILTVSGGWSAFVAQRDAMRERADLALDRRQRDAVRQRHDMQRQSERKARRDKAGRATGARGGQPRILLGALSRRAQESGGREGKRARGRIAEAETAVEAARAQVEILTPLHVELPPSGLPANRLLLRFDAVVLAHGGRHLFGPLSFGITGPRRIAIAGANGSGKTSLLRLATGALNPDAGRVFRVPERIAMLDQHVALLRPGLDLVETMRRHHPALTEREAHAGLARFAFRNSEARKTADMLSGGERLRAGLAIVMSGPVTPQLLILDEPTNHLDVNAITSLEAALAAYDGALLLVSHDDAFLDALGIEERIMLGG